MGSVWHATHLGLDIPCAVKFIEGEFAAQADAQARFEREAKAAAQLRSPHVVQILDHGVSDGRPYIAMELLDGEDLAKRLKRKGRLAPSELLVIVQQISRALIKAHQEGIVHRDLKPDNVFLVPDDDRELVKILDFGIAKSQTSSPDEQNQTRAGALLGTPYYMSPEQAHGSKSVDHRSDLWSLAVICFQCMVGKRPFPSPSLAEVLMQILVHDLPVPSQVQPDIPPGFDAWWQRAAARDPAQRFQSARDFVEGLAEALAVGKVAEVATARRLLTAPPMQRTLPMSAVDPALSAASAPPVPTSFQGAGPAQQPAYGASPAATYAPLPSAYGAPPPPAGYAQQGYAPQGYAPQPSQPSHYGAPPSPFATEPAASYPGSGTSYPGSTMGGGPNQSTGAPTTSNTGESLEASKKKKIPPGMLLGGSVAFVTLVIAIIVAQYWVGYESSAKPSQGNTTKRVMPMRVAPPPLKFVPGPVPTEQPIPSAPPVGPDGAARRGSK